MSEESIRVIPLLYVSSFYELERLKWNKEFKDKFFDMTREPIAASMFLTIGLRTSFFMVMISAHGFRHLGSVAYEY